MNDIEKERIEAELLKCESCGIKFNAHRLACHIIKNNVFEDEVENGKEKIIEIQCPHCEFKYDLVVNKSEFIIYDGINN